MQPPPPQPGWQDPQQPQPDWQGQQQGYPAPAYQPYPGQQSQSGPGFYGPPNRPRKTGLIVGCIAGAVVLIAGIVLTIVLLNGGDDKKNGDSGDQKASSSSSGSSKGNSGDSLAPDPSDGIGVRGDVPPALQSLGIQLQANLSNSNVNGLLRTVCEAGKENDQAKNDLLRTIPSLSDSSVKVQFNQVGGSAKGDSYALTFHGTYADTSGKEITVEFLARTDDKPGDGKANWCGVQEVGKSS
ncbi:MAG: hypothetical protein ACRD3Q_04830 [Terriglobales bacterium]